MNQKRDILRALSAGYAAGAINANGTINPDRAKGRYQFEGRLIKSEKNFGKRYGNGASTHGGKKQ